MADLAQILTELRQTRDGIRLKVHLGSRDLQDEWARLEARWQTFEREAEIDRSAKDLSSALMLLAEEIKASYLRVQKAL